MKLTAYLHPVRRLRIRGAIPPLPHMLSCYGTSLNTETEAGVPFEVDWWCRTWRGHEGKRERNFLIQSPSATRNYLFCS
jgi:hypothetical protein